MPQQNYRRRDSEGQPEWGFGDRPPYPYDSNGNSQPGHNDSWGWGSNGNNPYSPRGPPSHQQGQYSSSGNGEWGSPGYTGPGGGGDGGGGQRDGGGPSSMRHESSSGDADGSGGGGGYQRQQSSGAAQQGQGHARYTNNPYEQPRHESHHGHGHGHQHQHQHSHQQHKHGGLMHSHSYAGGGGGGNVWSPAQEAVQGHLWGVEPAPFAMQRDRDAAAAANAALGRGGRGAGSPDSSEGGGGHRRPSLSESAGEEGWDSYDDCWSGCSRKLAQHLEVFNLLNRSGETDVAGGPARASYKKQNNFLMKVIFDEQGECAYHVDCILRTFKISKGRLKRLQERIKRELRGEMQRHGLYGRPSNNRKKPETLRQFTDFVRANRINNTDDENPKFRFMLPPKITSIQGDAPGSLKTQFDKHQIEMSTDHDPRELVSSGTAQSWFKKYFDDTMPPSASHPTGSEHMGTSVSSNTCEDDQASASSDANGGTTAAASSSVSTSTTTSNGEKRPGDSQTSDSVSRKRSRMEENGESDENESTDGSAQNGSSDTHSRSDAQSEVNSHGSSHGSSSNGSKGANGGSSASDSGFGSVEGNNNRAHPHHTHHPPHHKHPHGQAAGAHVPVKKHGSDSDGSVAVESPELD